MCDGTKTDKRGIKSTKWDMDSHYSHECKWEYPSQNDCGCCNGEEVSFSCTNEGTRTMGNHETHKTEDRQK